MGFWSRFFNRSSTDNTVHKLEMVTDNGNGFYTFNGDIYQSDIVRSCIKPRTKAFGKTIATHIRRTSDDLKINPEPYMRMLLEEPNPYMSGQMMQEKVANQLALNNNAFILIIRDENGYPMQLYPIPAMTVEVKYDKSGDMYLKFLLKNGKSKSFYYRDIIHLRDDYYDNDVFGESPALALVPLMEVVTATDQGIVKAIQNSNVLKWLLKFTSALRPEDIKKQTKEFVDAYLSIDSESGGAAGVDAKYDLHQVKPESYVPNAAQMDRTVKRILNFFNINEAIIQSKYSEDDWNAFYESVIEPLAMQAGFEFSRKLFTRKERAFGNKIIFESSSLQYASMGTKLGLWQMVDRGSMLPNEWRRVLNLGPIEGGDKPIRRLDTAEVSDNKPTSQEE